MTVVYAILLFFTIFGLIWHMREKGKGRNLIFKQTKGQFPEEFPGLEEIRDHPIFHMKMDLPTIDEYFDPELDYPLPNEYEPLTVNEWRRLKKGNHAIKKN